MLKLYRLFNHANMKAFVVAIVLLVIMITDQMRVEVPSLTLKISGVNIRLFSVEIVLNRLKLFLILMVILTMMQMQMEHKNWKNKGKFIIQ